MHLPASTITRFHSAFIIFIFYFCGYCFDVYTIVVWGFKPKPEGAVGSVVHNFVTPGATTKFSKVSDKEWTVDFVVSLCCSAYLS